MIVDRNILFIFLAVLLTCTMGFKKYIWFISIGYGWSISVVGLMLLILYGKTMDAPTVIMSIVLIAYGFRLSGYLTYRELRQASYNKLMKNEISDGSGMGVGVKIALWISCAALYVCMTSPVIYRCANGVKSDGCLISGIIITVIGVIIEAVADAQKNKAKKENPYTFVRTGLYKYVRCPNYFGEIIIWTGVFVSGISALKGAGQWIIAILGYLGIIYIMFSGARRLELRQDRNYGSDPEYQKYSKKTPIILPFIPLYSVSKYTWLVG